jgi:hypothetical protein
VIIQASHVGYDPDSQTFGTYRRLQAESHECSDSCGKTGGVPGWYLDEYTFARENIFLGRRSGACTLTINNQLLNEGCSEGLFLQLARLLQIDNGNPQHVQTFSTARYCLASSDPVAMLPAERWPDGGRQVIGRYLVPELFSFKRNIIGDVEGRSHLEQNLLNPMPWVVTSHAPLLVGAQFNTRAEFDHDLRTIVKERAFQGRRLVFISCLNIDISPREGQLFPLTKCVPRAAFMPDEYGNHQTLEQAEIIARLEEHSTEYPDQIDLEDAIV